MVQKLSGGLGGKKWKAKMLEVAKSRLVCKVSQRIQV
jgi:hypothetical protein